MTKKQNEIYGSDDFSFYKEKEIMERILSAGIKWNRWPEWNGIRGRDRLEYAFGCIVGASGVLI